MTILSELVADLHRYSTILDALQSSRKRLHLPVIAFPIQKHKKHYTSQPTHFSQRANAKPTPATGRSASSTPPTPNASSNATLGASPPNSYNSTMPTRRLVAGQPPPNDRNATTLQALRLLQWPPIPIICQPSIIPSVHERQPRQSSCTTSNIATHASVWIDCVHSTNSVCSEWINSANATSSY